MTDDIDARKWIDTLAERLREQFGDRLLLVGLQGSRRRDEATPTSDIDSVVVLDELTLEDLTAFRAIVKSMPRNELACGFIGGVEELRNWPRHDVFQLAMDTETRYGDPSGILPEFIADDAREAAKIGAANVYHMAAHTFAHGAPEAWAAMAKELFKSAAFALFCLDFIRGGVWAPSKGVLASRLEGDEAEILSIGMHWDAGKFAEDPERYYRLLLKWSGGVVRAL